MFTRRLIINTLCEFGPVFVFFAVYTFSSFHTAVAGMMAATLAATAALIYTEHHPPFFALLSSGSVMFFGGLSLIVDAETIFILRDTVFDVVMGLVLIISVVQKKPLFKYIFKNVFAITDRGWSTLSLRWGIFFLLIAAANEIARLTLTSDAWVLVKAGIVLASVLFGAYQFTLTRRERLHTATAWGIVR